MKSGYELISKLDPAAIDTLIGKGILRSTLKRDLRIYEYYISQCRQGLGRMQARTNTAEKFKISEDRTSKIIQKMR